jgi:hypothetical protein
MPDSLKATARLAMAGAPTIGRARRAEAPFVGLWRRRWLVREPADHVLHETVSDGKHDFDVVRDDAGIVQVRQRR